MRAGVYLCLVSVALMGCVTTEEKLPEGCGAPATAISSSKIRGVKNYQSGVEAGTTYDLLLSLSSSGNRLNGSYALEGEFARAGSAQILNTSYCGREVRFSVYPASNPGCRHDFVGQVGADRRIEGTFRGCSGGGTWWAQL